MVPGVRDEQRNNSACRHSLWQQRSPHCRILLQGPGAGAARRHRHRCARGKRNPVDQRIARRMKCAATERVNARRVTMAIYTVHEPPLKGARAIRNASFSCVMVFRSGLFCWRGCGWCGIGYGWCLLGYRRDRIALQVVLQWRRLGFGDFRRRLFCCRCWLVSRRRRCAGLSWRGAAGQRPASWSAKTSKQPNDGFSTFGSRGRRRAPSLAPGATLLPRRCAAAGGPTSSACFPRRERSVDRCDRRLRFRKPAFGRQGIRTCGARAGAHAVDSSDARA